MAHRRSPARIAKRARIAALHGAPAHHFAKLRTPPEALAKLEAAIVGKVFVPGMPGYDDARKEANPAFQAFPQIIVYCEVPGDVAACLELAVNYGLAPAVRSGGHSSAGYSVNDGIVIDMSSFKSISMDSPAATLTVGPGVDFDHLNGFLNPTGFTMPTGACGNVNVGGFMQGGGFGYTSRNFGINCDAVVEVQVMLWDASVVRANAGQNVDLFWAVRGGTGGNFGVLLEVTYQLQQLNSVWAFAIQWDVSQAAAVLYELQQNYSTSGAPQQLGFMMNLGWHKGAPVALIQGMFCGSPADGKKAVASLMAIPTAQMLCDTSGTYGQMDHFLEDNPYDLPDLPAGVMEDKITGYVNAPLTQAQWQAVADQVFSGASKLNLFYTEGYGGAINAWPQYGNAFVHRNCLMNIVIDAFWTNPAERIVAEGFLDGFQTMLDPLLSGEIYQNYPRRTYANYRDAYWGGAFQVLLLIKQKYDPDNLFRYDQSVSPWPNGEGPKVKQDGPVFAAREIVYERRARR